MISAPATAKDTRTSDVKNYEYQKSQGYEGSFEDFMRGNKDKEFDLKREKFELDKKVFEHKQKQETGKGEFGNDFTEEEINKLADKYAVTGKHEFASKNINVLKFSAKIAKRSLERQKAQAKDAVETLFAQD